MNSIKTIHVSHNDLDGFSCGLISKLAIPERLFIESEYKKADENVCAALDQKPDALIISDLFPSKDIDQLLIDYPGTLYLFDHHVTQIARQESIVSNRLSIGHKTHSNLCVDRCATSLMAEYFGIQKDFVQLVNTYDMSGTLEGIPGALNTLFWKLDRQDMENLLLREPVFFNKSECAILNAIQQEAETYLRSILNMFNVYEYGGMKIGFIEATEHKSYVSNELLNDCDYLNILDTKKNVLSLRGNYDGCDEVASKLGGGGHAQAAGVGYIPDLETLKQTWKEVLNT